MSTAVRRYVGRIVNVVWLVGLWLLLWRDVSAANVLSGLAIALVVTLGPLRATEHRVRPLALVGFLAYFAWKLLEANIILAREVVTPQNKIHTGIVGVPLPGTSDFVVTVVGNAVSLTPGTLTLEVWRDPVPTLYVHVLHLHDLEETRDEVLEMARRAKAAFPSTVAPTPGPTEVAR